jgi:hypothetical protein
MAEYSKMSLHPYDEMLKDSGLSSIYMSDRDMVSVILRDLDYEAQLIAISGLLRNNDNADAETDGQIKQVEEYARKTSGLRNQRAVDEWVDLLHGSTYQSAAHSMAALGMLAPFYESMFFQAFQGIRISFFGKDTVPPGHHRAGTNNAEHFWDCHLFRGLGGKMKTELVAGIKQLADAVGFTPHLPTGLPETLDALFSYRNKMFHRGFEWPKIESARFAKRIGQEGWQAWFSCATHGGEPWIFYMTDEFIKHCFDQVHPLLDGFGAYCRSRDRIDIAPIQIASS